MKVHERFVYLISSLYWRSTSNTEDGALCIAPLLGRNAKDFIGRKCQDWIEELVLKLPTVPVALLFFEGPRVQEYGKRWIPKSFLKQKTPEYVSFEDTTTFCDRGLRVTRPGCLLKFDGNPFTSEEITFDVHGGLSMTLTLRSSHQRLKDAQKRRQEITDIIEDNGDSDPDEENQFTSHIDVTSLVSE